MPATETLHDEVASTLKKLQAKNPGLKQQLQKAHAYAVFPSVGKASLVVGGSYGRGEVFEKGKVIGTATISQLTVGVQVGGDTFSEILIFDSPQALDRFKQGKTSFAANASTVLVKAGATGTKNPEKGVKAYAYSRGGMLLELAIGGQRFKFKPADEQTKRGKAGGKSQRGAAQSREQDEPEQEQDEGGVLSRATGMVKNHPILSAVAGAGVAAVLVWYASRGLRAASGSEQEDSDDRAQDEREEEQEDEGQDQDQPDDESEDEGDEQAEDSADDDGGEEQEQEDDAPRFLKRWRSRA